jgi:glyoxylase-like metal-dependent hydrolase (beta-lactamase superfamily II)
VPAAIGFEFAVVAIAKKGVVVKVGFEVDAAAIASVAAGGAAARNVFFTAKGYAAIAAVTGLHEDFGFINKHGNKTPEKDNISELRIAGTEAHLLKRLALILLILVCVMAAALYVLYFQRMPLPAVAPHARVAPAISTIPGIAACWVETGKTFSSFSFGSTAGSVLVRHPAGDLLIDTGNSSHFDDEIRGFPFGTWLKLKSLAGELKVESQLPQLLHQIGEDPAKLRWAILSHVHLDHAGGLMDLPPMPVLLTREELQFANDPDVQARGYVIAAHTKKFPAVAAPTLKFDPLPYETFDESADLYKDGSVVVVPLRGHTPGSLGIFVNLSPERRMFYVGDAVDDERGVEERAGKSLILQDSDNDKILADQIVGRLSELHEKVPGLAILPAHGRSAYKKFFPGGPQSCVSNP